MTDRSVWFTVTLLIAITLVGCNSGDAVAPDEIDTGDAQGLHTFSAESIDGQTVDLARYKGKVVLIVNVASRCGNTPQYADLQRLYEAKRDQGLVILGLPANDFGRQEPGTN